ncbi:MAG: C-terminal target protein [Pedosphaera sp.]|nr:C-terminal target protein [Pedosphaera sp.]
MKRAILILALLGFTLALRADVAVMTQHNDNGRTGMNLNETTLNVTNVNTNQFGLVFSRVVDDQIYAQPLIATNVNLGSNGVHNLVLVCTVNDSIYAFDADNAAITTPYWQKSYIGTFGATNIVAPRNTDMTGACGGGYVDFSGNMGIVGTPVIDPASGTMYVVVRTKETVGTTTNYPQKLHALDLATGNERPNSPVTIAATFPGTSSDSVGGIVTFDSYKQNQRPALLLANGIVYITWSSHCDWGPYHGWIIGYNTSNLLSAPVAFNLTPNGNLGGIWMSGMGPAADNNGNVYLSTGNGSFDGLNNFGESFVKLSRTNNTMNVASWFTPYNWNTSLNPSDLDLGTGGVLLIPGTNLMLSGGKAGWLYLVNRDAMGGLTSSTTVDNNVVQTWSLKTGTTTHSIHGGPVWWDGPNGSYAYIWAASKDRMRQLQFNRGTGLFNTNAVSQSATVGGSGQAGGTLAVSANGTNAGTGIVWAYVNTTANANNAVVAGTLHAYNAQAVTSELWNSDMVISRDAIGNISKFNAPTVANGKVYMATFSTNLTGTGALNVYGLLPRPSITASGLGGNLLLTWPTNGFPSFTLQTSTNLTTTNWSTDGNTVVVTNGNYQVTIPTSPTPTYYRLKR